MDAEREKQIREIAKGPFGLQSGGSDTTMGMEILAEIDRLRADVETWKCRAEINGKRGFEFQEKLAIAEKTLQMGLDFYHLDTQAWVDKYALGLTTRQLGDAFRAALTKIRGDKSGFYDMV